jgi:ribosomal protein L37AE/L43A
MSTHIHCPACMHPIEISERPDLGVPPWRCERCGRRGDAVSWDDVAKTRRQLEGEIPPILEKRVTEGR